MDFIHNNNISNSILIIGNGFDLDLGIKTKYIDYVIPKKCYLRVNSFMLHSDVIN